MTYVRTPEHRAKMSVLKIGWQGAIGNSNNRRHGMHATAVVVSSCASAGSPSRTSLRIWENGRKAQASTASTTTGTMSRVTAGGLPAVSSRPIVEDTGATNSMVSEVSFYGDVKNGVAVFVDGQQVYPKHFSISVTENGMAEAILYFTPKELTLMGIPRASDGVRETRTET